LLAAFKSGVYGYTVQKCYQFIQSFAPVAEAVFLAQAHLCKGFGGAFGDKNRIVPKAAATGWFCYNASGADPFKQQLLVVPD
jgi:hypothetical protein